MYLFWPTIRFSVTSQFCPSRSSETEPTHPPTETATRTLCRLMSWIPRARVVVAIVGNPSGINRSNCQGDGSSWHLQKPLNPAAARCRQWCKLRCRSNQLSANPRLVVWYGSLCWSCTAQSFLGLAHLQILPACYRSKSLHRLLPSSP